MTLSRAEFQQFLADPEAFGPTAALLQENAAMVDELLSETALEAAKRRFDETFQRGIRTFYANTEPRKER